MKYFNKYTFYCEAVLKINSLTCILWLPSFKETIPTASPKF